LYHDNVGNDLGFGVGSLYYIGLGSEEQGDGCWICIGPGLTILMTDGVVMALYDWGRPMAHLVFRDLDVVRVVYKALLAFLYCLRQMSPSILVDNQHLVSYVSR